MITDEDEGVRSRIWMRKRKTETTTEMGIENCRVLRRLVYAMRFTIVSMTNRFFYINIPNTER